MKTETIQKTQTEGLLEMTTSEMRTGTKAKFRLSSVLDHRLHEMEGRISGTEDTREEMDTSVKENVKSKKFLTQKIQEIWTL